MTILPVINQTQCTGANVDTFPEPRPTQTRSAGVTKETNEQPLNWSLRSYAKSRQIEGDRKISQAEPP